MNLVGVTAAAAAGDPGKPMEDWHHADSALIVVLDGATARTDTGCVHGIAWFTEQLGTAIVAGAKEADRQLRSVLGDAISHVAALHPDCDLSSSGTPSAGVAALRIVGSSAEWLVLGDVTIVLDTPEGVRALSDTRIRSTAVRARLDAHRWPIGSPEKTKALRGMKHQELAARNRFDGYWIAAADPIAARHALAGAVPVDELQQAAVLTDGVERLVSLFKALTWNQVLTVARQKGPQALIDLVRQHETRDPLGTRYHRNKASDDATAVYAQLA